jgi:DNA-binding response OmpR family regulator
MVSPAQKRVLIIEDETTISMLVADMLDELGYEAGVGGSDTKGATDAARTEQVDMAVLDLSIEDGSL